MAGAVVSGVVRMPDVCSPAMSPAVVYLDAPAGAMRDYALTMRPAGSVTPGHLTGRGRACQSARSAVRAARAGDRPRSDRSVHQSRRRDAQRARRVSPGFAFNQSMAPGQFHDFTPAQPGVMKLACDIHQHMRGFVVVSPTPWVRSAIERGDFGSTASPDGRYILTAWHEMGDPVQTEITLPTARQWRFPSWSSRVLLDPAGWPPGQVRLRRPHPCGHGPDVIDRIGVTLAASRDAAVRPGELAKARRLADDAYWGEFESSDMETAVRKYLGFARPGAGAAVSGDPLGGARRRRETRARCGDGRTFAQADSRPGRGIERSQCQGSDRPIADRHGGEIRRAAHPS